VRRHVNFLWVGDLDAAEYHTNLSLFHAEANALWPLTTVGQGRKAECAVKRDNTKAGVKDLQMIRYPKTGPFRVRVFRVIFPWLGGAEDDESLEVFGRAKGVHSPAGR
jgi:hypothetical protein